MSEVGDRDIMAPIDRQTVGNRQIGDGEVMAPINGQNAVFTAFKTNTNENDETHFREVIVCRPVPEATVPFPFAGLGTVGSDESYATPALAQQAARNYILGSPNGSMGSLNRWWTESTQPISKGVTSYPDPQNSGYAYKKTVKLVEDSSGAPRGLIAFYDRTVNQSTRNYCVLIATPNNDTPTPDGTRFDPLDVSDLSAEDFENAASSLFSGSFVRSVLYEDIRKLTALQSFPTSWF